MTSENQMDTFSDDNCKSHVKTKVSKFSLNYLNLNYVEKSKNTISTKLNQNPIENQILTFSKSTSTTNLTISPTNIHQSNHVNIGQSSTYKQT